MEGCVKYKRAWSIDDAFAQHQSLVRQLELQSSIGQHHIQVRQMQADFARLDAVQAAAALKEALLSAKTCKPTVLAEARKQAEDAAKRLRQALQFCEIEERRAAEKTKNMELEIEKSNLEMVVLREAIDDIASGGGPVVRGLQEPDNFVKAEQKPESARKLFYCTDCRVGGHGQRFCSYLLKRPNWRVYPSEMWFEDKSGQVSHCPLGRRGVDFTDETYFSRIAMHIKGRIWLEDKRKLYEFVPDLMPYTYVIQDCRWVGEAPPSDPQSELPWFVKETDRNWGTSIFICARPEECMSFAKPGATYVVQKHIERPLPYHNGEKLHVKFYNLLYGLEDGETWRLYCYKNGYLCISPRPWDPKDLTKEGQVTIIRTKRIGDWEHWPRLYPECKKAMAEVIKRAAAQGKLEGRNKKQFEIISSDFVVTTDFKVYLLEFNTGPVLRDPEEHPDVHDAGMIMGALHIVEPWEQGDDDQWDFALECKGVPIEQEEASPGEL